MRPLSGILYYYHFYLKCGMITHSSVLLLYWKQCAIQTKKNKGGTVR